MARPAKRKSRIPKKKAPVAESADHYQRELQPVLERGGGQGCFPSNREGVRILGERGNGTAAGTARGYLAASAFLGPAALWIGALFVLPMATMVTRLWIGPAGTRFGAK